MLASDENKNGLNNKKRERVNVRRYLTGQEGKNTAQIRKETKGSHLTSKQHAFSSLAAPSAYT